MTLEFGEDFDEGDFGFEPLPDPSLGSIGDFVWYDVNGDAVQDAGETGIVGVLVTLSYPDGTEETTVTDGNGYYIFEDLPAGDYIVTVGDGPAATTITTSGQVPVSLGSGEDYVDADFGFATDNGEEPVLGSIGDYVWYDGNGDGVQDAGESGIVGVEVTLTFADGTELTEVTDGLGNYLFDNLPAGDYVVTVGNGPEGTVITTADTDAVSLGEGEDYVEADFGFAPDVEEPALLGSIGDFVWSDLDGDGVQDPGEDGIENVSVTLILGDGTELVTTTDSDGSYVFDNLPSGNYTVLVLSLIHI